MKYKLTGLVFLISGGVLMAGCTIDEDAFMGIEHDKAPIEPGDGTDEEPVETCGDGVLSGNETCDDGNTESNDGSD